LTLVVVGGLGFGLIRHQYEHLKQIGVEREAAQAKSDQVQDTVRHSDQLLSELMTTSNALVSAESDVASGDIYSWIINTVRQFKTPYRVEIPQFSPIDGPKPLRLLPTFPYQQASLSISGSAHYHDLGRFLADFENHFPHIQLLNLTVELNSSPAADDQETLNFKMDVVTLVKPTH
jgi:hypothetical protein